MITKGRMEELRTGRWMRVRWVWKGCGQRQAQASKELQRPCGKLEANHCRSLASVSHFSSMSGQEKAEQVVECSKNPSGDIPQVNRLTNTVKTKRIRGYCKREISGCQEAKVRNRKSCLYSVYSSLFKSSRSPQNAALRC